MDKKAKKKFYGCSVLLLFLFSILLLAGCTKQTRAEAETEVKAYSKDEVIESIKKICPEDFNLICMKETTGDSDKYDESFEYTFETTERKLTFTAKSWRSGEQREIRCNYIDTIRNLYWHQIIKKLKQSPNYIDSDLYLGYFFVDSYADLKEVSNTLAQCNQIYAEEKKYNSENFLKNNPVAKRSILWFPSEEDAMNDNNDAAIYLYYPINGCDTNEEILSTLSISYTQFVLDYPTLIDSGDIPPEYLDKLHARRLSSIKINDWCPSLVPHEWCWYNYKINSYMICIYDQTLETNSLLLLDYMHQLNISYNTNHSKEIIQWKTGSNLWVLKRSRDEDGFFIEGDMQITKNGSELSNIYHTETFTPKGPIRKGYDLTSIPVDDFASMFDLKYIINEKDLSISFTSKNNEKNP